MLDIDAPYGTKVIFLCHGGSEWDKKNALSKLKLNGIYTVSHMDIHDWWTDVYLKETPSHMSFNSCLFEEAGLAYGTYKEFINIIEKVKDGRKK